ncbi:SDR family NAD(P)-dependent oxidoreductase [Lichenicoccus sp.]|uniref:SDR family NAD(P)-dependent oxidoreductase n=1 Tax=Lichenicoccus sp. TaxID=2781899 RepID=UPI003D0FEA1A
MIDPSVPFRLAGKVAVVTGAARGIGRAASVALAQAGADVVGIDIAGPASAHVDFNPADAAELAATGALVAAAGRRWTAITLDQRDLPALRAAAAAVRSGFGGLDILFANAGIQAFKPILEMQDPDWHDQIDVNLTGTMNALRAFAPLLVERGGGRIIVTSSTQGQHGMKNGSAYAASKWGIIGLMKSAAMEFGEHKITVNALIPGLIDTPLTRHEDRYAQAIQTAGGQASSDVAKDEAAARTSLAAKSPLGVPWIAPEDVAPMVVFLASDEARMVSGGTYAVTAGDSANIGA